MLFSKSRKTEQTILLPQESAGGAVRRRENAFASARRAEAKLQAARAKKTAAFLLAPVAGEEAAAALFSIVRVEERRAANRAAQTDNGAKEQKLFARRHYESRPAFSLAEWGECARGESRGCLVGDASAVRGSGLPQEPAAENEDALDGLISGLTFLRGLNVRERGGRTGE